MPRSHSRRLRHCEGCDVYSRLPTRQVHRCVDADGRTLGVRRPARYGRGFTRLTRRLLRAARFARGCKRLCKRSVGDSHRDVVYLVYDYLRNNLTCLRRTLRRRLPCRRRLRRLRRRQPSPALGGRRAETFVHLPSRASFPREGKR